MDDTYSSMKLEENKPDLAQISQFAAKITQ